MKRLFIWFVLAFITAIILLFIIAAFQTKQISPKWIDKKITSIIQEKTGRHLSIHGDTRWHLLPSPSVTLQNISLDSPDQFKGKKLLSAQNLKAQVALLPLLLGRLELKQLILSKAQLHLITLNNGDYNFKLQALKSSKKHDSTSSTNKLNQTIALTPLKISLINSTLAWVDHLNQHTFTLKHFNLSLSPKGDQSQLNLQGLIKNQNTGLQLKASTLIQYKHHQLEANQVQINGNLIRYFNKDGFYFPFTATTQLNYSSRQQTLNIKHFKGQLMAAQFSLDAVVNNLLSSPNIQGQINVSPFNLNNLLVQWMPQLDFNDDSMIRAFAINTFFNISNRYIKIDNSRGQWGKGHFRGYLHYSHFSHQPKLDFNYNIDLLDLHQFSFQLVDHFDKRKKLGRNFISGIIPKEAKIPTVKNNSSQNDDTNTDELIGHQPNWKVWLQPWANLIGQGHIHISRITSKYIHLKNINISFDANNNTIALTPITANLYNGTVNASSNISVKNNSVKTNIHVHQLAINQFLNAIKQQPWITGLLNATLSIHSKLSECTTLAKQSIKATIDISKGEITAKPVIETLKKSFHAAHIKSAFTKVKNIPFTQLSSINHFQNHTITTSNFKLINNHATILAHGSINTLSQDFQYHFQYKKNHATTPSIPFTATGNTQQLNNTTLHIDLNQISQSLLGHSLHEALTKQLQTLTIGKLQKVVS